MNLNLHDTHFHLDLFNDTNSIISQIEKEKIYTIAVTNIPDVFLNTKELTKNSKYIRPALGFHPELASKYKNQLSLFKDLLGETRYIGEIGLDNYNKTITNFQEQKKIFEQIISTCHETGNKILTVHSRRAEKEVISIIGPSFNGKVILHWYSGPVKEIETAINNGFYFSVNHAMTISDNGKKIIDRIPFDRLLLETDGPFVSINKKPSSPNDVGRVLEQLSHIKVPKKDLSSISHSISENFKKLLS